MKLLSSIAKYNIGMIIYIIYISNFIIQMSLGIVYGKLHIFLRGENMKEASRKNHREERRRGKTHLRGADVFNDIINFTC